jgi:hypothetical protein
VGAEIDKEVSSALAILIDDEQSPEARSEAAKTLGQSSTRDPNVVDALLAALTYDGPECPATSPAASDTSIVWSDDIDGLIKLLRGRWRWRSTIKTTLERWSNMGPMILAPDPFAPEQGDFDQVKDILSAIELIGDRSSALSLADQLQAQRAWEGLSGRCYILRVCAAEALGRLGDRRAVSALVRALDDEDDGVRSAAAEALGKIGDKRAIGPLKKAVRLGKLEPLPPFGKFTELFPDQRRKYW